MTRRLTLRLRTRSFALLTLVMLSVLLSACGGPGGGGSGVVSVAITGAPSSNQVAVGSTVDLDVTVTVTGGASSAVEWTSSNVATATVDASGTVSAFAVGTTTITATSTVDAGKSDSVDLEVVTSVTCTPVELDISYSIATTLVDLVEGCPDYVSNDIAVNVFAPLTVDPGVTIAFLDGVRLSVKPGGSLTAVGSAGAPITFTGSVKEAGSWGGIDLASGLPSVLEHVVVEYGVKNIRFISDQAPSTLTLANSIVRHSQEIGLEMVSNVHDSDLTGFSSNTFTDNPVALRLEVGNLTQLDAASSYAEPGSDSVIEVTGGPAVGTRADGTWLATGVDYVVADSIRVQHAITVEDGVTLLFTDGVLLDVIAGSLTALGTNVGIVFSGTETVAGHWDGIHLRSEEVSTFDNVTVEYGGGQAGNSANIVMLPDAALTLTNSTIAHSADFGLYAIGDVTITPDNESDLLAQNTFQDNATADIEGVD